MKVQSTGLVDGSAVGCGKKDNSKDEVDTYGNKKNAGEAGLWGEAGGMGISAKLVVHVLILICLSYI